MAAPSHSRILILDFGSQVTQLIARRLRETHVYCEIHPFDVRLETIERLQPEGVVLSGGPASVYDADAPKPDGSCACAAGGSGAGGAAALTLTLALGVRRRRERGSRLIWGQHLDMVYPAPQEPRPCLDRPDRSDC